MAYVALVVVFVPLWPDFETARRGVGIVLGGVALATLALVRAQADLPRGLHVTWLSVALLHLASCAWSQNTGDALARSLWLFALWAFATVAARTSSLRQQLAAIEWPGIAVAGFGVAQAMGLEWPAGYSFADNAVSTLGNRNVASEFAVLALVAAALRLLRHHRVATSAVAVTLGAAYVWLNHSRAGLLAGGLTLLPLLLAPWRQHPRPRRMLLLALLVLGIVAGQVLRSRLTTEPASPPQGAPAGTAGAATDTVPADLDEASPPSTIEVRTELWTGGLRMLRAAPLFGVGAGQFQVQYPRFRSQREIELSTHGRAFPAAPRTAHQDALEIAVEVGVAGLIPYLLFWILVLRRRRRGVMGLLPVVAFLVLGLVRSPLGNAPAAAFTFACLGALSREQQSRRADNRRWLAPSLLGAGLMLWVGGRETAGQCAAARYVAARLRPASARSALDELHALDRAVAFCPWDASLRELQVAERFASAEQRRDIATVRALRADDGGLTRLLALKPFSTAVLLLAARVHQAAGDSAAATACLRRILDEDPANPDARLFLATLRTRAGDAEEALALVYADGNPHARLRAGLAAHLHDLATLATDASQRAMLQNEAAFVDAVDALTGDSHGAGAVDRVVAFVQSASRSDLRPLILMAAASLQRNDRETAERAAAGAPAGATLAPVHARLLRGVMRPLRDLPDWHRLLPEPAGSGPP